MSAGTGASPAQLSGRGGAWGGSGPGRAGGPAGGAGARGRGRGRGRGRRRGGARSSRWRPRPRRSPRRSRSTRRASSWQTRAPGRPPGCPPSCWVRGRCPRGGGPSWRSRGGWRPCRSPGTWRPVAAASPGARWATRCASRRRRPRGGARGCCTARRGSSCGSSPGTPRSGPGTWPSWTRRTNARWTRTSPSLCASARWSCAPGTPGARCACWSCPRRSTRRAWRGTSGPARPRSTSAAGGTSSRRSSCGRPATRTSPPPQARSSA